MVFNVFVEGHHNLLGSYFQYRAEIDADDYFSAFRDVDNRLLFLVGVDSSSIESIIIKVVSNHVEKSGAV